VYYYLEERPTYYGRTERIDGKDLGDPFYSSLLSSVYIIYSERCTLIEGGIFLKYFVKLLPRSDPELTTTISRSIRFPTEIEDDIKKAIINYCRKCPVSKLLKIIL
jgi:putative redox protein